MAINYRVAVCDDDAITLDMLREVIAAEMKNNEMDFESISVFKSGKELLDEYFQQPFDVIFLDIKMPDMDGFDIAARLREISDKVFIIFVTTQTGLVYNSFDFQPFHFIRKLPLNQLEVQMKDVIKKLSRHIRQNNMLILELSYNEKVRVSIRDILYISSEKNYLIYHLNDSGIKVRGKISELEEKYAIYDFVRVHKRVIVNMRNIVRIDYPNDEIILKDKSVINIGRIYRKELQEKYTMYLRSLR